jgi:hypothetical protein
MLCLYYIVLMIKQSNTTQSNTIIKANPGGNHVHRNDMQLHSNVPNAPRSLRMAVVHCITVAPGCGIPDCRHDLTVYIGYATSCAATVATTLRPMHTVT